MFIEEEKKVNFRFSNEMKKVFFIVLSRVWEKKKQAGKFFDDSVTSVNIFSTAGLSCLDCTSIKVVCRTTHRYISFIK